MLSFMSPDHANTMPPSFPSARNFLALRLLLERGGHTLNAWKTKYMEIGRHRDMMVNGRIRIGCNSYDKLKTFSDKSKFYSRGNKV
jgi:hypothetical protein